MSVPFSIRPKITSTDISRGYILRYFVTHVSILRIIEIDKFQYDILKVDPLYNTIELKWMINGVERNFIAKDGNLVIGTRYQNETSIAYYNNKMPGLNRILRNPSEYFFGVKT